MRFLTVGLAISLIFLAGPALAQTAADLTGHWEGGLKIQSDELKIVLDFSKADAGWKGTISIPAQGAKNLPLENITIDGLKVGFAMVNVPGEPTFDGKVTEDGSTMSGDYTQGGITFPFQVRRMSEAEQAEARKKTEARKPESNWEGILSAGPQNLRLVLHIFKEGDGAYSATLDSPDQNASGLQATAISISGADLHFELKFISASYDGKLSSDGSSYEGTFQQAGQSFPLTLKKVLQ